MVRDIQSERLLDVHTRIAEAIERQNETSKLIEYQLRQIADSLAGIFDASDDISNHLRKG